MRAHMTRTYQPNETTCNFDTSFSPLGLVSYQSHVTREQIPVNN